MGGKMKTQVKQQPDSEQQPDSKQQPEETQKAGQLVIIGGAEDKDGDCKVLREFVRCAGGAEARIAVMTVATELPREVGDDYIRVFERLGVEDIRIIDTVYREDADNSSYLKTLDKATGVFFTGGDQARITDTLKDTEIHKALHRRYREGMVVGGTSAGASMMSDTMILEGDAETNPRIEVVELDEGMSFLPEAIVDQHFAQRGRLGRLLAALAAHPHLLGLGIDEDTAIVIDNHRFTVVGNGACTVVDLQEATHNNIKERLKDEALALGGIKLHILPERYSFDLKSRTTIAPSI